MFLHLPSKSRTCNNKCYYSQFQEACPNQKDCFMVGEICDGRKETSSCGFNCAGQRKSFDLFNQTSNQCITAQLGTNNPLYRNVQSFIKALPAKLSKLINVDSLLGEAFLEYYSCKHRPGAKYQNNQCINARKSRQEYACLNRMDIDEAEIKNSAIFTDFTATRINHYKYFSRKNLNGKIITCGKDSLKTACDIRQGLLMLGIPAGSPVCMVGNIWFLNPLVLSK